jgi:hypothetical protein
VSHLLDIISTKADRNAIRVLLSSSPKLSASMARPICTAPVRWTCLLIAAAALVQTSCGGPSPPKDYSVGIAYAADFDGDHLTLHTFRLFSDGFLLSTDDPPIEELKGKVLLQITGLKVATKASAQLGTGLQMAGAAHDSAVGKAGRERMVSLKADEYSLTKYSQSGEESEIPTVDINMIILEQ